jgi:hypothetical protein
LVKILVETRHEVADIVLESGCGQADQRGGDIVPHAERLILVSRSARGPLKTGFRAALVP